MDITVGRTYKSWKDECGTDQVEGFFVLVATDEEDPSVEFVHFYEFVGREKAEVEALRDRIVAVGLPREHFEASPHWEMHLRDVHEAGQYLQEEEAGYL